MSSSKLLKERIESIQDTMKITNAMYLISSSKLRKARQNYQNVSPYFNRMRDTISRVVPHLPEEPEHPFFHERNLENPRRRIWCLLPIRAWQVLITRTCSSFCGSTQTPTTAFMSSVRWLPRPAPPGPPPCGGVPLQRNRTHFAACPRHHGRRH